MMLLPVRSPNNSAQPSTVICCESSSPEIPQCGTIDLSNRGWNTQFGGLYNIKLNCFNCRLYLLQYLHRYTSCNYVGVPNRYRQLKNTDCDQVPFANETIRSNNRRTVFPARSHDESNVRLNITMLDKSN